MDYINLYNIHIYERYRDLKRSKKEFDNYDLSKIFEWYSCIKLYELYNTIFYEYNDIDPDFKEENKMSRNDTGIDCCNLINTICQCKLRDKNLTLMECASFFASQNIYSEKEEKTVIRWDKLVITRNKESVLSKNLLEKTKMFKDVTFPRNNIIEYCERLLVCPPTYPKMNKDDFVLRDYQKEAIYMIKTNSRNIVINLPTGCGKNVVMIYSFEPNKKYVIFVPRIILMEQLQYEICKHKPELKNCIQCIGDNNTYYENKNITICVYNSVKIVEPYFVSFDKIYIDEAHHIDKPMIYEEMDMKMDKDIENDENIDNDDYEYADEEEIVDDSEDEIKETTGYSDIIKSLSKYNNNVYLSATIDEIKDFMYYKKELREMIEQQYLCDYNIHIPIFKDEPTNRTVCEHLIRNYRNVIIYCNSQKEGKSINQFMNKIQNGCSEYIDCKTPKAKRNNIIKKYKEGEISFLVNVRILVEGFDAPITKGIVFLHLPSSKTTLVQIIGRALRKHSSKTIAHIILPFSKKDDETSINHFLKVIAKNDSRIRQSYTKQQLGGYISIEKVIIEQDNEEEYEEDEELDIRYNMIFDNIGNIINGHEIWMNRLNEVKLYIDENNKRPSNKDKSKYIKQLGLWIGTQIKQYKKKIYIMKNQEIRDKWNDFINDFRYKKYFESNEDAWKKNYEKIKQYINENNTLPSRQDKNEYIKSLAYWIQTQRNCYIKNIHIMIIQEIRDKWNDFINDNKYKIYFESKEEKFLNNLKETKNYIDNNNKRPSRQDKNEYIKNLGIWMSRQINNNTNNNMINEEIYNKWNEFINSDKYKKYFESNQQKWYNKLEETKNYINTHNKRPTDKGILGKWVCHQVTNYNNKKKLMKTKEIYDKWTELLNDSKYKKYFK